MSRGHSPWRIPDAVREYIKRQPGQGRSLSRAEITKLYPGVPISKPPVRFGEKRRHEDKELAIAQWQEVNQGKEWNDLSSAAQSFVLSGQWARLQMRNAKRR